MASHEAMRRAAQRAIDELGGLGIIVERTIGGFWINREKVVSRSELMKMARSPSYALRIADGLLSLANNGDKQ